MPPTIEQWQEWRKRCALLRCGEPTMAALRGFAWLRFQRFARILLGEAEGAARTPSAADCWHLLESRLAVGRLRSGRRYKEWLFARLESSDDAPLDVIQGGATLLMRDVARYTLAMEAPPAGTRSLDVPTGRDDDGPSLAECLPAATGAPPEQGELAAHAAALAEDCFGQLDLRARLVLLAKRLNAPLYHPVVLTAAHTSRTRASEIWRAVYQRLAAMARDRYSSDDSARQLALALAASDKLAEIIFRWGRAEKQARPLFVLVEEPQT
ncbi:MAG: hypothetical protein PHR35_13665 [Kiritimatiellae bacterium]|nr:hypothetical protein [Kiritimatiellia bacterium]